ncbi:hypothetical protein AALP_AAs50016U000300 [Arabis alpina]|uniref:ditrans,polycis-polyprenyl diphosphate synthase [(2E,6E)-farnesyldiphosphate specific] n=1 Tax=Arabis alpina TaxID=50452 RepID=A0A087FWR5_ARAAL|nr:hypothetical protein AALP_AAs50016U000300 [Arabis alpina]
MDVVQLMSSWIDHLKIGDFVLYLLWRLMHILVSFWYIVLDLDKTLESCLTSLGFINHYCPVDVGKIPNLAIVVEPENYLELMSVIDLIPWLKIIGVKKVCLFDSEGLMKKFKGPIMVYETIINFMSSEEADEKDCLQNGIRFECLSSSDNKEAMVKAANVLFQKFLDSSNLGDDKGENIFTEAHLTEALRDIGESGHEPDLLLVYGPMRCHYGFPAWRLRYTEIIHMGPLKDKSFDSLKTAIHKFTKVRQNYGT